MFTISAFYFGETLHAKTTSTLSELSKNNSFIIGSASMHSKEDPATIIAYFLIRFP